MDRLFEISDYKLLSKKVYRVLKARIVKGDLAQGGKLFEAKIAEQLGVRRTPVR
jgi:DNA-binding GntR family transcriptional regulator